MTLLKIDYRSVTFNSFPKCFPKGTRAAGRSCYPEMSHLIKSGLCGLDWKNSRDCSW